MVVQGLLLIAVIAVISGTIFTSTLVTARTALHQTISAQARTAMSDATADFVAWAQSRVASGGSQTSWAPKRTATLANDTSEFKPICGAAARTAPDSVSACGHWERNTWMVTGATTVAGQPGSNSGAQQGVVVKNLARTVDEQRITAIVSSSVESSDGRLTFSSESRQLTARIFDAPPYAIVTGTKDISSKNGDRASQEGDSGGFAQNVRLFSLDNSNSQPNPDRPANVQDTRIVTTVDCVNTAIANQSDPFAQPNDAKNLVIDAGRQGDADWAYQMPCAPTYKLPAVPNAGYLAPVGNTYATVDDSTSQNKWRRDSAGRLFPL